MRSLQLPTRLACIGITALAICASAALALLITTNSGTAQVHWSTRDVVAVGGGHVCAIGLNSKALCWGANDAGQANPPDDKRASYEEVDAGVDWSCLREGSRWTCFGSRSGESDIWSGVYTWSTIYGTNHSCPRKSFRDREYYIVECQGHNTYGQAAYGDSAWGEIDAGLNYWRVGADHNCLLDDSGEVSCWGRNHVGQTDVPDARFSAIAAGKNHNCGVTTNGEILCWGDNFFGQTDGPQGDNYVHVWSNSSADFNCASTTERRLVCWGDNSEDQLDVPPSLVVPPGTAFPDGRPPAASGSGNRVAPTGDATASQTGSYTVGVPVPASDLVVPTLAGRVVARVVDWPAAGERTCSYRIEFGFLPETVFARGDAAAAIDANAHLLPELRYLGCDLILPRVRTGNSAWLRSSSVIFELDPSADIDDGFLGGGEDSTLEGRVITRWNADSNRIEFGFLPAWALNRFGTDAAAARYIRLLPRQRYLTLRQIDRLERDLWLRSNPPVNIPISYAPPSAEVGIAISQAQVSVVQGEPFADATIATVTGTLADDLNAFTISGLPAGLSVRLRDAGENTRLAVLSGTVPRGSAAATALLTLRAVGVKGESATGTVRLQIAAGPPQSQRIHWNGYSPASQVVGGRVRLSLPTIEPGPRSPQIRYSAEPSNVCTVNPSTGALTLLNRTGTCTITVSSAAGEGFAAASETATVVVTSLPQQNLVWDGYDPPVQQIGGSVRLIRPMVSPGPESPTFRYVSETPQYCRVTASSGALTLLSRVGACVVTVTSAATASYAQTTATTAVQITDLPAPRITWDGYSPLAIKFGDAAPRLRQPAATNGGRGIRLVYRYSVQRGSEAVCSVSQSTGALTIRGAGNCTIIATSERTSAVAAGSATASIVIERANRDAGWSWSGYGRAEARVGETLQARPPTNVPNGVTIRYASEDTSICTVDAATGAATLKAAGTCRVTATSAATNTYATKSASISIESRAKDQPDLAWFGYSPQTATVGGEAPQLATRPDDSRVGTLRFSARPSETCTVDSSSGTLTITAPGTCTVSVTSAATTDLNEASRDVSITVQAAEE